MPPLFLGLRGHLGAGKSVLARAIARGAGVETKLPSPTFNLLLRYPAVRGSVVHLDLYRVHDPEELKELAWDELGAPDEIVLIEWPERAGGLLPADRWDVELRVLEHAPHRREVSVRKVGMPPPLPAFSLDDAAERR